MKGIFKATAGQIEQIKMVVDQEPCRADRPVILRAVFGGGIPALDNPGAPALRSDVVIAQPGPPDHGAAGWDGGLLILGGEYVRPERVLLFAQCGQRFMSRMESFAGGPLIELTNADRDAFVDFCSTGANDALSEDPRTPIPTTSVSPIISAVAVDAVRRGLRTAFCRARSPEMPRAYAPPGYTIHCTGRRCTLANHEA